MEQVSNPFQALKDIFIKPNRVFATIADTHNWSWLPFILVSVVSVLPIYYYFNIIDFEWYKNLVIQTTAGDLSPAERNNMGAMMHQAQLLWVSVFGAIFSGVVANAILALYLNITTKSDEECVQGYTDWYGFTWWASMPGVVFSLLALLVVFVAQDNQLSPVYLGPTTLAFILGVEMQSPWFTLMQAIRLETIWIIYLVTVGLSQWTQLSSKKIYIIAIAPYIVIWGFWALFLLLK